MKSQVIQLQSQLKLSPFRLEQLNKDFAKNKIYKIYNVFIIDIADTKNLTKLKNILKADDNVYLEPNRTIYIAPRLGTISPWSSKATDILHNCGLENVIRIECAKAILFESLNAYTPIDYINVYDRMMESVYLDCKKLNRLFNNEPPLTQQQINISKNLDELNLINIKLGLALSQSEKEYLQSSYQAIDKEPTQAELMMFSQANSEHCRHKIFNAKWTIDDKKQNLSLFSMIRNTEKCTPKPAISAYKDNSAVFHGGQAQRWNIKKDGQYYTKNQKADILIKVETHNHPTAISPFPGAATGNGGEIRDEAATGQGSRPKAGLTGYSVSHLKIPNHIQSWEQNTQGKPDRIASPLSIMLEAPIGGAAFNNEFGRPNICGYFRNLEITTPDNQCKGYHKPIMLAGGLGTIDAQMAIKQDTQGDDHLIVLGGPAMLIGLGGGAASSVSSGTSCEDLDFASVQRGNPEMQRRAQEVIDACWVQQQDSPIRSIHDVGAGGLSNAMPELLDDAGLGGILEIRNLQIDNTAMTPMEIWCNESQERYVISIKPEKLDEFLQICHKERCPVAVLGQATSKKQLIVTDAHFSDKPVDIPMDLLFGNTPKTLKNIKKFKPKLKPFITKGIKIEEAVKKVLNFPTVASKKYLITIGDRTVSGLVHRDQMVGPWQVPVADCGVTFRDYTSNHGEAMAIGEKAPLAIINGAASAKMAVCEALLNIAANNIGELSQIKLSANWMAASGIGGEDEVLFEAVQAIGMDLCPKLGIGIPVGKDSLSMNTAWDDKGEKKQVTSPVSLIISAFSNVQDVSKSITPYFDSTQKHYFYYIDLANGKKRMGASTLAQVYQQIGDDVPDVEDIEGFKAFWLAIQKGIKSEVISAYHDISDGGMFITLLEMCIASRSAANINLDFSNHTNIDTLFCEELGVIVAIQEANVGAFNEIIESANIAKNTYLIGQTCDEDLIQFYKNENIVFAEDLTNLNRKWSKTSHLMASLRDNPSTCEQEFALIAKKDKGLTPIIDFDYSENMVAAYLNLSKPKMAILREQGVNGQKEMAMAFYKAGFDCYDVHMQDLLTGHKVLDSFQGLAACGGFSYGDVLGAGVGWANSILFHDEIKAQFSKFFHDNNKFALGVCNGCQMLSSLKEIIPGSDHWPEFLRNNSEQFEARFSSLEITQSESIFFQGMQGARIPVAIAHGEGRAHFQEPLGKLTNIITAKYADNNGNYTQDYPFNPNGSEMATAAVTNTQGNIMAMMPHPERVFRTMQMSWYPKTWQYKDNSPWMRMFYNAREFIK